MPTIKRGNWRVYMNGIDTPAQSVTIQTGAFTIPEANIVLAPDKELLRIGFEDRMPVAVFYLDDIQTKNEGKAPEYRLLFEGEVTGWTYQNTPLGRSISFSAVNHAAIFTQLFMFFMTSVENFAEGRYVDGASNAQAGPGTLFPASLFFQGITAKGGKPIKRPYDFVENIFRALVGTDQNVQYNASIASSFFSRWCRRTNFLNRWAPSPYIEGSDLPETDGVFPILKALQSIEAVSALINLAQDTAANGSLWNLLSTLLTKVYYEFTLIPNMPLVTYDLQKGVIDGPPEISDSNPAVTAAQKAVVAATEKLDTVLASLDAAGVNYSSTLLTDPRLQDISDAQTALNAAQKTLENLSAEDSLRPKGRGPKDPLRPLRLINYVTKPQLQFCVPPRCNIIMPSMVTGYSYQENYTTQPTRLMISDDIKAAFVNQGAGLTKAIADAVCSFAFPRRAQRSLDGSQQKLKLTPENFTLFPEEFYKGPVVSKQTAPEWFWRLANEYKSSQKDKKDTGKDISDATLDVLKEVEGLYAEYEYEKERSSQKSGGITMRFNPYVVPGFPCVVFDQEDTNVHLFAYVLSVSHTLTNSEMSTSINYSHSQTFDEFFNTLIEQRNGFHERVALDKGSSLELNKAQVALQQAQVALEAAQTLPGNKDLAAAQKAVDDAKEVLSKAEASTVQGAYQRLQAAQNEQDRVAATGGGNQADENALLTAQANVAAAQADVDSTKEKLKTPDMAPAHPIQDIRARFQDFEKATEYYAQLFDQGLQDSARPAGFNWLKSVGVLDEEDPTIVNPIDIKETSDVVTYTDDNGNTLTQRQVVSNTVGDGPVGYALMGKLREYTNDSELAMQYVGRPICSLSEYVDFQGDYGIRQGQLRDPSGAFYYIKILDLLPGPGDEPTEDQDGNRQAFVPNDTREDWSTRLLNYRKKVLSKFFHSA